MHDPITMTSQTVPDIDDVFGTWPADSQSDKGKRLTKLGMLHGGEEGGEGHQHVPPAGAREMWVHL